MKIAAPNMMSAIMLLFAGICDSAESFHTISNKATRQVLQCTPDLFIGFSKVPPIFDGSHRSIALSLAMNTDSSHEDTSDASGGIDIKPLGKYFLSLCVQMGLITSTFKGLDKLVSLTSIKIPFALNVVMFYFMALKSRVFNPLSNRRPLPKTKEVEGGEQRKMPTWTPAGFVFPIVWLLLIGPLRAVTSSMIYKASGSYVNKAILSLMLHLSIGDIWNTINNVERRYGTSVLFMVFVWASAAHAAFRYSKVLPLAGKLLSLKLIWLTIAASLIVRTWQINPDPKTERPYALLPKVGDGAETNIVWFTKD
jgi:tryptophan-rich sensory protein